MGLVGRDNYIIVITILIDLILSHIKAIKPIHKSSSQNKNLFLVSKLKPRIPDTYKLLFTLCRLYKTKRNPQISTQTWSLASRLYHWTMGHANQCWYVPGKNLQVSLRAQPNGVFKCYGGVLQRFPIRRLLQSSIFDHFEWFYFTVSGASNDNCYL